MEPLMRPRRWLPLALALTLALPPLAARAAPLSPSNVASGARQGVGQAQDHVGDAIQWLQQRLQELGTAAGDQLTRDLTALLTHLVAIRQTAVDLPQKSSADLEQLDAELKRLWAQVESDLQEGAAAAGLPVIGEQLTRLVGEMMVETRGHVTHADGTPAQGVVVVRFLEDSLSEKWLSGVAVTDANGDYTLLSPDGLVMAFRHATGLVQDQGVAVMPSQVVPLELLPATPPYQEVTYDAAGNATVTPGDRPLSVWDVVMREQR